MDTCRLCLSMTLVNNCIFGDDNKILIKLTSCLPVKVTKEDSLPKKICDICSCKVDDFYQFCHRALDSENRLIHEQTKSEHCDENSGEFDSNKVYQFSSNFNLVNGFQGPEANLLKSKDEKYLKFPVTVSTQTEDASDLIKPNEIKREPSPFINDEDHTDNQYMEEMFSVDHDSSFCQKGPSTDSIKPEKVGKHSKNKKSKKNKELKIKIKKIKTSARTGTKTDSDDEEFNETLNILKAKQVRKPTEDLTAEDNVVLGENGIKVEFQDGSEMSEYILDKNDDEVWNCCVCFYKCNNQKKMLEHYKTHYKNPPDKQDESVITEAYIEKENKKKVKDSKKSYTCSVCEKKFESKTHYSRHIKKHGYDKAYPCSLCEKTFKNPLEILKHGKKAHTYDEEGRGGDESGPRPSTKRFMCDICDETFVYMKYLLSHREAMHPEVVGRALVNRCMHCRREFTHLNSLRRHLRSHSGERNFLCYMCGKALTSREHLKFHIRIHTGFKPHECKTCGKGFVKKCNLTLHERVHSGERPHVCSHCGKAFSQRSTLVIHERYHSGSRPYVCSLCHKGFVAKGLLSMHMKTSCI